MSVSIRPSEPGELKRLAGFLPAWKTIPGDESRVAEASEPARLAGWAILGQRPGDDGKPMTYLDAAVLPRFRDGSTLADLLGPLIQRASSFGNAEIYLATPRDRGTPEVAQFEQLGFKEYRSLVTYEFSLPEFAARARATHERLLRRDSIPESAQVNGLTPAHWPAAVELLRSEKLMDAPTQARAEREGLHVHFCPTSSVVTVDGELKGVVLTHARGRQVETSALAVDPRLRGGAGWVNALMSWRVGEVASALGYEVMTMAADPARHPMTTRLAQRMNGRELKAQLLLRKVLTNDAHI